MRLIPICTAKFSHFRRARKIFAAAFFVAGLSLAQDDLPPEEPALEPAGDEAAVEITLPALAEASLEMPDPTAPLVRPAAAGKAAEAAYWVVAENSLGQLTNLSPATLADNPGPRAGDKAPAVEITILPVANAAKYHLLKTVALTPPANVKITPGAAGDKTFYYWIVAQNTWRLSALGGPYVLENAAGPAKNVLSWDPVPTANNYQVFRTERPEKPLGYACRAVGDTPQPRFIDAANLGSGFLAAGYPATPVSEKPVGLMNCLLATVQAAPGENLTVIDRGQSLKPFLAPAVNGSKRQAVDHNSRRHSEYQLKAGRSSLLSLQARELFKTRQPTFGTGANLLTLRQTADSGGHSDRNRFANNQFHGKSNHHVIELSQDLHVATQGMAIGGYQRGYGSGDMIFFHPHQVYYGTNNDGGDEGVYPIRQSVSRLLNEFETTLAHDAPAGATKIRLTDMRLANFGTERLLVNYSQAHAEGRIAKVNGVNVRGGGTGWTAAMEGRWISFDIENVRVGKRVFRMWHLIARVDGPEKLTFRAFTNWSDYENLGYSRWIYDPAQESGPAARVPGNSLAIRNLPRELHQAAGEGRYLIAAGSPLGGPRRGADELGGGPPGGAWNKGDRVAVVAGPQAFVGAGRIMLNGDYLPQDLITGLQLRNSGNRKTNSAGIQIGVSGQENFADGVKIVLAKDGQGNGLVISGATHWNDNGDPSGSAGVYEGAIVLPANVRGLVGTPATKMPHLRFNYKGGDGDEPGSLEVRSPAGLVMSAFTADGKNVVRADTKFTGELRLPEKMRGSRVFSGDGSKKSFAITFDRPFPTPPFVNFSTNQFANARLVSVTKDGFTVEFQEPPAAGDGNLTIHFFALM